MNRLKDVFTDNLIFKLLAVVVSVIIWLLVVNIDDPKQSRNFTTNVEVINENVLTKAGKYYTIPEGLNTVTFRVTARRSVIEQLSTTDFKAVADMAYLEDDNRIPIEITVLNHANNVTLSSRINYLQINVGNEMSSRYVVEGKITGKPTEGCVVDSIKVLPDVITIDGPEEIVSKIARIEATCDVSGMNSDFSQNVVPKILDSKGNAIDTTRLNISDATVQMQVKMANIKDVQIVVETSGQLGEGYELSSISAEPEVVTIKGDKDIINSVTEIVIPGTVINLDMVTEDMSTMVDITSYLPEGTSLLDTAQSQIKISVEINLESTNVYKMPVSNISLRHVEEDLEASYEQEFVDVEIQALPSVLERINEDELTGSVDLSGLGAGSHTVRVDMDSHDEYTTGAVTVKVLLEEQQPEQEE